MNVKKKSWYLVGAVAVIVVAMWLMNESAGLPIINNPSASKSPTASATPKTSPKASAPANPNVAMPKSYSDALTQYSTRRIQFDQYCQAIPTSLVFKNNVSLMLDNRSGDARMIKIGTTVHSLSGYGWKIISLSVPNSSLPARFDIDCGAAQNVSYIMLER